jgi:hypothetical protein
VNYKEGEVERERTHAMAVPFETGVGNLQSMFPDLDREVICAVLEANNGRLERTVDFLLGMGVDSRNSEFGISNSSCSNSDFDQIRQDEFIARMLQDELFIQELRQYPELISVLDNGAATMGSSTNVPRVNNMSSQSSGEIDIADKLKQLGDAAKLKFKELVMKFKTRSSNSSNSSNPSVKYSPINNEDEGGAEFISFDSSLSKRTSPSFVLDEEEESASTFEYEDNEVPLDKTRSGRNTRKNEYLSSSSSLISLEDSSKSEDTNTLLGMQGLNISNRKNFRKPKDD